MEVCFWVNFNFQGLTPKLAGSTSGLVRETDYTYDNNTGNLLTKTAWRADLPSASPMIRYVYDTYGNVTDEYDANSADYNYPPTHVDYEPLTHTYPEFITNPIGHIVKYVVDYRYGYAGQKIDVSNNNNTITYSYDVFGRLILTQNPDGGETKITYFDTAFPRYTLSEVKETGTSYIPTYGYYEEPGTFFIIFTNR